MTYEQHKQQRKEREGANTVILTDARPTIWEQEHERVLALQQENVGLRAKVAELRARLAEIEAGIGI